MGFNRETRPALAERTYDPARTRVCSAGAYSTIRPAEVLPERRAIERIIHIQIEKDGVLAFGACDNAHPDCVVAGPGVPVALLEQLQASGC